jgi:hypothetical protein
MLYIERETKEDEIKFRGFIFFDYERMQVNEGHQTPNQVVATRVCEECLCNPNECDKVLCMNFVFKNNEDFGNWLFNSKNKFFIAIAHNM